VNDKQLGEMASKRNRWGSLSVGMEVAIIALNLNPWFQLVAFMPGVLGIAAAAQNSAKC